MPDLRLISGLKGTLIRGCMTTDDVYSSSHESGAKTSLTSIDPQMTTVGFSISLQLVNLKPWNELCFCWSASSLWSGISRKRQDQLQDLGVGVLIENTVLAETTGLADPLSKKPDHFRGKLASFIYVLVLRTRRSRRVWWFFPLNWSLTVLCHLILEALLESTSKFASFFPAMLSVAF